uniref:Transporter n=1 Tax=Wuchereria bancrofti TaxID=6293 RepID=A0A1I8EY42_WUCBA
MKINLAIRGSGRKRERIRKNETYPSMTSLTEGLKADEKDRDMSISFEEKKSMPENADKSRKKKKSMTTERDQWSGPLDFIMSMIAYAVGLGNVWRFPYLCFKNGGGSFLVVYIIFFSLGALPVFIMEITIGQYAQRGAMEIWNLCPLFKGVGIGNVMIAFMCIAYFCSFHGRHATTGGKNDKTCITGREDATVISEIITNLSKYNLTTETSVEQYWERRVLMQTDSISNFGGIQWELLGIMTLSWIIVYFALWKGITQARKFVYFCALSPYFMLAILLVRGFVVFSILGYMSVIVDKNIAEIVKPGPGLAFLAYPEVASNLPLKQVWSMLFFLMITILGLDSQICMLEGLYTALEDVFPHFLRKYKKTSLALTCLFFFILGIPMAGSYWLTLFDAYGASGIALLFVVFFEVTGLSWGFGAHKVRNALKEMIGVELWACWVIVWKFITPFVIAVLFFFCIYKYQPLKYPTGESFPRLRRGLHPPSDLETGLPPSLAFEQQDVDMEYIDCDCAKQL